jgi:hypothetical protein
MTKIRANPLLGSLEEGFARCHLGAQKSLNFQGPPLPPPPPMAFIMDGARIKIITSRAI